MKLDRLLDLLKRVPIDLGQGAKADTTEGKQIALRLVQGGHSKTALDVGCGRGTQTRWLRTRGYEVTSIDVEKKFADCIVVKAALPLPFPDQSFDLVWSTEVIEHTRDPRHFLAELRRVVKPGGEMILTTPNSSMWLFRLIGLLGLTPPRTQRADHLHFFALQDIEAFAPEAELFGYFPWVGLKMTLRTPRLIGALSPTFVMHIR